MRRPAVIAIAAMLVATVFTAAAPLALADEGRDRDDHHTCPAGMTCQTARPETAAPAATARIETEDRDEDNDIDEDEDENEVDDDQVEHEDAAATPLTAATASPARTPEPTETPEATRTASPSPTPTTSPNATAGGIDLATLQQLITLIRDFFAALAAQLGAS